MTTKFDLDTYIQKYKGYTVVQRLLFIAKKASGSSKNTNIDIALTQQACDKLVQVVKTSSGMNIDAYQEAIEIFTAASKKDTTTNNNDNNNDSTLSHLLTTDVDWMTKAQTRSDELKAQLEHDLEMFKQNLIKESVRMGHNDLASFHLQRGDPKSALQFHLKNRDYCTTRKHVLDMTLNIITVALYLGNHALVQSQAMKGQHIPSIQDDSIANVDRGKLDVALGLAHLSKKRL
jgi:COP9 signalosome complex subunit 1